MEVAGRVGFGAMSNGESGRVRSMRSPRGGDSDRSSGDGVRSGEVGGDPRESESRRVGAGDAGAGVVVRAERGAGRDREREAGGGCKGGEGDDRLWRKVSWSGVREFWFWKERRRRSKCRASDLLEVRDLSGGWGVPGGVGAGGAVRARLRLGVVWEGAW